MKGIRIMHICELNCEIVDPNINHIDDQIVTIYLNATQLEHFQTKKFIILDNTYKYTIKDVKDIYKVSADMNWSLATSINHTDNHTYLINIIDEIDIYE